MIYSMIWDDKKYSTTSMAEPDVRSGNVREYTEAIERSMNIGFVDDTENSKETKLTMAQRKAAASAIFRHLDK